MQRQHGAGLRGRAQKTLLCSARISYVSFQKEGRSLAEQTLRDDAKPSRQSGAAASDSQALAGTRQLFPGPSVPARRASPGRETGPGRIGAFLPLALPGRTLCTASLPSFHSHAQLPQAVEPTQVHSVLSFLSLPLFPLTISPSLITITSCLVVTESLPASTVTCRPNPCLQPGNSVTPIEYISTSSPLSIDCF